MKRGDFYRHLNGEEYYFCCIALPINETTLHLTSNQKACDAHTPTGEEIQMIDLYHANGVTFINRDEPHVIYQSEKDYDTNKVWARKVDNFFGYKIKELGQMEKRFTHIFTTNHSYPSGCERKD
ncbi:hypothetical protein V7068_19210 [Bacillus sp. JJ634]